MKCNCTLFPARRVPVAACLCTTWSAEGYTEMLDLQDSFDNQTTQPYTRPRKNKFVLLEYKMEF